MNQPRRAYADGPYGQVHYLEAGEGAPVVLIHQAPMNAHQFDAVFAPLAAAGLRVIAIDMPGCGQSDPTPFVPAIADYAAAVPAVLDRLDIAAADIVGHHTGALIATEVALHHPDRVRRLMLHGAMPLEDAERAAFLADVETRERGFTIAADGSHLAGAFAGRVAYCGGSLPLARVQDYILWMIGAPGPFWYGHHAAFTYAHPPRLAQITHPTLLLTNTGDAIYPHTLRAAALRPDWPLVALEGGGIDMPDEAPGDWARAVIDFLEG